MSKPWYRSKTVWFNILTIGGAFMDGLIGMMPTVQPLVPVEVYPFLLLIVGLVNMILRVVTTGPIDWTEAQAQERPDVQ